MARQTEYGVQRRRGHLLVIAVLSLIGAAAPIVAAPMPAAAAAGDVIDITRFGSIAIDPVSGRVFVAGDDKVVVFDSAGAPLGTIGSVYGAQAMSFDDGYLWVTQTTAGSIAKINPSTLAKVGEFATGGPVGDGIATVGGLIWFTSRGSASRSTLKALDPTSGTVTSRGDQFYGNELIEIPGSDTHLLWPKRGSSPYSVYRVDLRTNPATIDGNVKHGVGSNVAQVAATESGTFVTASGAPYRFNEFSTEPTGYGLLETGVVYPGAAYPNGVAYSPAHGGVIAGTTASSSRIFVSLQGIPVSAHEIALPSASVGRGVALSDDAGRVYALTGQPGQLRLNTYSLAPTLASTSTNSVVADQTERVTASGAGLGSIDTVTLGGVPVPFASVGANSLVLDVRTHLPAGTHTLLLSGPFGSISKPLGVVPNGFTTVRGTIVKGHQPVSGATVALTSETDSPRTTTTGPDGTYELNSVPNGRHYDLVVASGDVTIPLNDLDIAGPTAATFDIDLLAAPTRDLRKRTMQLPPGPVRRLVVDQSTGRTYVAVGDQIAVFDRDGRSVGRITGQWSVSDLQILGTKLYAMLRRAGTVSIIDLPSLTVDRSVPLQRTSTGSMAVVANRLFFVDGDDQWTNLVSLDLTTGMVSGPESGQLYTPALGPVGGDPNGFLSWEVGISSSRVMHWDAETSPPTPLATTAHSLFGYNPGDFVASDADAKIWAADGRELNLATMTTTGVNYPKGEATNGAAAHSTGHGGVLVFGRSVSLQGIPLSTHLTQAQPAARSVGIDSAGDRMFAATANGNLVVSDLAPVVNVITPSPVVETPTNVVVAGSGLGGATAVTIDGASVPFSPAGPDNLNVSLPSIDLGRHVLIVETPWGTSVPRQLLVGTAAPATVSAITPATGPATGGSTVTLTGHDFQVATSVSFGGRSAEDFTVLSDTEITVTVPAHPAGNAPVVVSKSGVDSVGGPSYRYIDPRTTGPIPALAEAQEVGGNYRPFSGDFNGDGVDDIFMYQPGPAPDHLRLYRGDGTFTTRSVNVAGNYQPLAGDFNGDGTTDVLWYAPGTAPDFQWDFAADGSYVSTRRTATGRYQPFTGDFNGDGYDDIFWYAPGTAPDYQWNYGPGDTYQSVRRTATGRYQPFTGDFDADGYDDIFWYAPGTAPDYQWNYAADGSYVSTPRTATGRYQPFTGDFDGDGYDDIFWYAPGPARDYLWSYRSGGAYQSALVNASMDAIPVVGDFTGGGIDDIFWYGPGAKPDSTWFMSPIVR